MQEHPSVTRFREFLRIKTVQPTPDYASCTIFLQEQARQMGLPSQVIEVVPGKPVVVISWVGKRPELKSIFLNCHTDVVPVFEESWTQPPFAANKLPNGDIIARGTQDMKCVGMAYLEAIRNLMKRGVALDRTLHAVFVPDEEIGGKEGMVAFTADERFLKLNVGFALDEGLANPGTSYKVFYGERAPWWIKLRATGSVGHGSQFIKDTAAEKLYSILGKLLKFREAEEFRLANGVRIDGSPLSLGDVTTVNWTMASGGVQMNVVPKYLEAGVDIRVSPSFSLEKFRAMLHSWCKDSDVTLEFVNDTPTNPVTSTSGDNLWWQAIKKASAQVGVELDVEIFPAATDSRFLRLAGVPALGVSPIRNTKILLHDHDESLNESVFLEGIAWYEHVLTELGNVTAQADATALLLQ